MCSGIWSRFRVYIKTTAIHAPAGKFIEQLQGAQAGVSCHIAPRSHSRNGDFIVGIPRIEGRNEIIRLPAFFNHENLKVVTHEPKDSQKLHNVKLILQNDSYKTSPTAK